MPQKASQPQANMKGSHLFTKFTNTTFDRLSRNLMYSISYLGWLALLFGALSIKYRQSSIWCYVDVNATVNTY